MARPATGLSQLARIGFSSLTSARDLLGRLGELGWPVTPEALEEFAAAADPDEALQTLLRLGETHPAVLGAIAADPEWRGAVIRTVGVSRGLTDFLLRHPEEFGVLAEPALRVPTAPEMLRRLHEAVRAEDGFSALPEREAVSALRIAYRREVLRIVAVDTLAEDPRDVLDAVAAALSDAASAALSAALAIARAVASDPAGELPRFPRDDVRATRLAIIGMGKAGAGELNYVSDVDVIYVAEAQPESEIDNHRAIVIATRLATIVMRSISESALEPALWEVDPNLRPEGKQGALVRTLDSHLAYYERWAKSWEFQALLKHRYLAGDAELGARYHEVIDPLIWESSARENFVESVQRMRERVTANIPSEDVGFQLKLGPGGLRDIEFTVQLLQLVHGATDASVRVGGTVAALRALADAGYIGREESGEFMSDYRLLRVLEHRLQLQHMRRTHLMPREEDALRILARGSRLAASGGDLVRRWEATKQRVRQLHERLFYRPLLAAVAELSAEEARLSPAAAGARLAAIGFRDPVGALGHIAALTNGISRSAAIQRNLLPVLLRWLADGADPDYGLLAFRRLSDALGGTHWFLRMVRDSSGVAERLTRVLSGSRFIGELLDRFPEAAAWLESDDLMRPRPREALRAEVQAILSRNEQPEPASRAVLRVRRREILRLALASVLGVCDVRTVAGGLTSITEVTIEGLLDVARRGEGLDATQLEFAIIGMGRLGGGELGFGSDADVIYVYRAAALDPERAARAAGRIASEMSRLSTDARLPLDLDLDLRPEGRNGALVRSLDSYRAYYARWSLTWEAQALLRARPIAGDADLCADFTALADTVRYPTGIAETELREVRRIKARVEGERLPKGADPTRHVKLGRGSLSDVEWFTQLVQLEYAAEIPELRTTSTLDALSAAEAHGFVSTDDAEQLREAWLFASRVRSAMTLWLNRTTDVLPRDRDQLEGIARILEYPGGAAGELEQDYLRITRRSRVVFEHLFYDSVGENT
ncbi:bifunctional [glutamine synthetase] adenylyltransferase/[glutamine synthetase]-adenylyl-L-tyrosine phosphorylase [Mycetocola tolaasinivorans]|uniref:Bifunctional [glutamine synthetase] adenylyltransferase/[glutamine synthetase]-adenylyl-L-tyrosine phosphorylase n=1 Tax=Mycetocola tolaasinivorans TaxID=76635 RepID=A0A3L7AAD0_9MICO|nr:bifunctional [glutamine synthetase] adenylyltransferase/[glutamine synthetase]-adenylyl-L-tyrosine phosphorylase [Mycetocola tolaasinivorans]RLP76934.1 bifunctional [glutamine synthetase] adenylyltransferase/[glutamine synthetase]-adenylyl-L-tyrosine phosphorylase [Mycetocola tolaasinivorans]